MPRMDYSRARKVDPDGPVGRLLPSQKDQPPRTPRNLMRRPLQAPPMEPIKGSE